MLKNALSIQHIKKRVLKAKDIDTVVTGRPTGHPVRILKNRLARELLKLEKTAAPIEQYEELGQGALAKAVKEGDMDMGSIMAGQIAGMIIKEQTCSEIIEEMFDEFKELMNKNIEI